MNRLAIALVLLTASCSAGMRQPAHSHPFCEGGHLVLPGQYLGQVAVPVRQDLTIIRPLFAGDTVCMRRPPSPPATPAPQFPDSGKP